MARGRPWTEAEDAVIERATFENWDHGIVELRPRGRRLEKSDYAGRLRGAAEQLGRSYAAVLKRAQRIGAASYTSREKETSP